MIMKIGAATRKLVKNQHTWFRDDGAFLWVDNSAPEEDVLRLILGEIEKPEHQGRGRSGGGLQCFASGCRPWGRFGAVDKH
jgi:hypothetical protein